jgi:general secretion pathway protein M
MNPIKATMNNAMQRRHRWIALGLLLAAATVAVTLAGVPWYIEIVEYNETIDKLEDRLRRYAAKSVDRKEAGGEAETIRRQLEKLGIFNAESTGALALADMQEKIKTAVAAADGNLMSTQVMAQQKTEGLTKILVKVRFAGRVETLKKVLYELETAKPYMLVENLQITSVRGARNPTTRKIEAVDKINVMLDVSSFMQAKRK